MENEPATNPAAFKNPHSLKNRAYRLTWKVVAFFMLLTPPRLGWPLRKLVLRIFGAKIGKSWLHSSVRIWAPSRLQIGDHTYIDSGVYLYNPWPIQIGDRVIISFNSLICTPSHDFRDPAMPLIGNPVMMECDSWIAANCMVGPGVTVGRGSVLGAGAAIFKDTEEWSIYVGNPAKKIGERELASNEMSSAEAE